MLTLHPDKKSTITIHYDYIIGNEVPYYVGNVLMEQDKDFSTNCLEFFCFDSPVKEVIVLKADGSFISRNQLLNNQGVYCSKEIRLAHNIYKMLIADTFIFQTIEHFKLFDIDLPEAIGNLVWRSQKSFVELCGEECAILDEGYESTLKFPDIEKTTIMTNPAYTEGKTPPQPISGQESEFPTNYDHIKITSQLSRGETPSERKHLFTLPNGEKISVIAPTPKAIGNFFDRFMSTETKQTQEVPINEDFKSNTIRDLLLIQVFIIDNLSNLKKIKLYDSHVINDVTSHFTKKIGEDKITFQIMVKTKHSLIMMGEGMLDNFAQYIEQCINEIKSF